ncbi:unnamed protein product [Rhizophagus irregularis]|nr:unnamed protein product [Rhizophagus irregularis]
MDTIGNTSQNISQFFSWNSLPDVLKSILPQHYTYSIINFNELPSYQTAEDFVIPQFELDVFVDVNDKEKASEWFVAFQSWSKPTMPETKRYEIKGKYVLFRETRHCIHSDTVKKKQGSREVKRQNSLQLRNTSCKATIHLRLESWRVELSHPLEVNIKFTHNHVINSAESLSFRRVNEKVCEKFLQLFKDGYSPASAMYVHEDELYLSSTDEQDLLVLLADRANNPDYDYIAKLFQKYRETSLGDRNGSLMFRRLVDVVNEHNSSGRGKAILQEYDSRTGKALILCVVTGLMSRVHEKIPQSGEICYVDALASFEPLNTSITLLCTSCAVGALPLGLFITSDELEIMLEKALNLLKSILPQHAFFGRGLLLGPKVILTDNSSAERNALELCWPEGIRLLCSFHVLQAFWRWLHNSKHHINKEDRVTIMAKMKEILYAQTGSDMYTHYDEFKQQFYHHYPQLRKHFELLWERRCFWALSFRSELHMRGNNTNNYIERSFGILKDIVFARTQAYNCVQTHGTFANSKTFFMSWLGHREYGYYSKDEIGTCTCPIGASGAPCKHQGAVSVKFHISTFNFLPSLTSSDRMLYAYIALGYTAKDNSFYASLHAEFTPQDQESLQVTMKKSGSNASNASVEFRDSIEEVDNTSTFIDFLEEIKEDYQNGDVQLRTALNKLAERYKAAKMKSVPRLVSFLYDMNRDLDPTIKIKSGPMIRVQVESVKRRKTEGSGRKRKLPASIIKDKENLDPQAIPSRKTKQASKKEHNLSKNILKNQPN